MIPQVKNNKQEFFFNNLPLADAANYEKVLWGFDALQSGASERSVAEALKIPKSTFHDQIKPLKSGAISRTSYAFFNSDDGQEFLSRLLFGLLFWMITPKSSSIESLSAALKCAGIGAFRPISYGSLFALKSELETTFLITCKEEKQRMMRGTRLLYATIVMDETWLDGMYLVAIDAVSWLTLLEKMSDQRTAEAWENALRLENPDLEIVFIQATSDEAAALINFAKKRIGGNHSPDLFHILNEICKGLSLPLHNAQKRASNEIESLIAEHREIESVLLENVEHLDVVSVTKDAVAVKEVGEPTPYNVIEGVRCRAEALEPTEASSIELACNHLEECMDNLDEAVTSLNEIRQTTETFHECLKDFSRLYHPVSLTTGIPRNPSKVKQKIYAIFGKLENCATIFRSEKIDKHLRKAKKVGNAMQETLEFVHNLVQKEVAKYGLSYSQQKQVTMRLIPAAYLDRVALQAKTTQERTRLQEIAKQRREKALESGVFAELSQHKLDDILKLSKDLSGVFQRSSSCVEGRNGMLSQKFHSSRGFSAHQVEKFTYWGNFVTRRADNSTAAERFCGMKQRDICKMTFERLNEMPYRRAAG